MKYIAFISSFCLLALCAYSQQPVIQNKKEEVSQQKLILSRDKTSNQNKIYVLKGTDKSGSTPKLILSGKEHNINNGSQSADKVTPVIEEADTSSASQVRLLLSR